MISQKIADAIYMLCVAMETFADRQMIHEDNDGQLIVYTGLKKEGDQIVPWEDPDFTVVS